MIKVYVILVVLAMSAAFPEELLTNRISSIESINPLHGGNRYKPPLPEEQKKDKRDLETVKILRDDKDDESAAT